MERAQLDTGGGNATAALAVFVGILAFVAAPAGLLVAEVSNAVTLHWGIAGGGAAAALLGLLALLLARRGRARATLSLTARGSGAASGGRLLGTLAFCIGIAAAIALATDALLTHFEK